jgi:hypothetical protein
MKKPDIILIDPALKTNEGLVSDNLGDCVISESTKKILAEIFPTKELVLISPHVPFSSKEKKLINDSVFTFVGGTNILTSDIRHFPRLSPKKTKGFYLYPGIKNLILIGAGWSQYDSKPDWATVVYYKHIFHKRIKHSLRDTYTLKKLNDARIKNCLFTSCPTTWELDIKLENQFNENYPVLCTLTDYNKDTNADTELLKKISTVTSLPIYFFPQGSEDISYLKSLQFYKDNTSKFKLLPRDYNEFKSFIESMDVNYIGTRLHAGIKCLSRKIPSLIIGIDNRALEMRKDLNLPVIKRSELRYIDVWLEGNHETIIKLPQQNIADWKKQFSNSL